ncbi:hypothetical protein C8A05DRAFT_17262 [Staphylotrichum tortipilum]|uniref:Mucin n=1 Tax=Staphylotrichum tortipilum TaxID=2831512 RepID=A0AAN6MGI6_9PEZI|nr:hypothetical protein C8A05DRAFT_17262 [Staphylotrichum longicolle]
MAAFPTPDHAGQHAGGIPGLVRDGAAQGEGAGAAAAGAPAPSGVPLGAGVAPSSSSSAHPFLEDPSTAQTTAPASCFHPGSPAARDLSELSSELSSFINSPPSSSAAASPRVSSTHPFPNLASHPDDTQDESPSYTFYLAPSSPSRSSHAHSYSLCSSNISGPSIPANHTRRSIGITIPGKTRGGASPEHRPPLSSMDDYFSSAYGPIYSGMDDTTQLRPGSSGSTRSERNAIPLSFARWARRHYQHQHQQLSGEEREKASNNSNNNNNNNNKRHGRGSSKTLQKRQTQARAAVPQMTREEFEALPLAIQRKYFSTLERLRFAQESGLIDGISQHYDDISNFKSRKPPLRARNTDDYHHHILVQDHQSADQDRRDSVFGFHTPVSDSSPLSIGLPEATHETATWCERQQQLALAAAVRRRRRGSVVLDAADETLFKQLDRYQASSRSPAAAAAAADVLTPPHSPSSRDSMDSRDGFRQPGQSRDGPVPQSFYDSFRWMDEEEDLDLRLFLDDYHANLRESAPTTKQRPSFRRHMSVSKIPFGRRSSVSSTAPVPHDMAMSPTSPIHSPPESVSNGPTHTRRKSRALSLLGPRYDVQPAPLAVFDPSAAHYQDPEARLKLRVYLASPQKFDEAVEFGFPSADSADMTPLPPAQPQQHAQSSSKHKSTPSATNMRTFLASDMDSDSDADDDNNNNNNNSNDNLSLHSPPSSLGDPDSPKTPEPFEHHHPRRTSHHHHQQQQQNNKPRHNRFASAPLHGRKTPEPGFASREMTLRMTLTRPDLRAREDEIYGWQQGGHQQKVVYHQQHARRATALAVGERGGGGGVVYRGRESMEPFPELDHWNEAGERGVMRRIWNRVRRG